MSDYPRMMYRTGGNGENHKLGDVPIKIHGKFDCDTLIVEDAQEEADAMAEGWTVSPDPDIQSAAQVVAATLSEKDAEIAQLKAELAEAQRRKGGRPPQAQGEPDAELIPEGVIDGEQA